MGDYIISNPTTIEKLFNCFGDTEDFFMYVEDLQCISDSLKVALEGLSRFKGQDEAQALVVGQFLVESALFFRRNFDMIKDVVNVANFEVVDEEKKQEYMSDGKSLDMTEHLKKFERND